MDLTSTKAVVLVLLGLIKLFSGLAPLLLTRVLKRRDRCLKKFIGIVLCFGGGVLISTVFIHMLGEVRESLERAAGLGMMPTAMLELEYPFAELLLCLGFLFILLIESIVHKMFGGAGHGHSHGGGLEKVVVEEETGPQIKIPRAGLDNPAFSPSPIKPRPPPSDFDYHSSSSSSSSPSPPSLVKAKKKDTSMLSSLRSFLVVLALSVHSIFEGMAIGMEGSEAGVWKLFLAVAIHSTAIVFCIGTEMTTTGLKKRSVVLYMSILSIVTPIGVLIGIIVTVHMEQAGGAHVLAIGVLQGLAAGTLLYITFYEVLARDKLSRYGMGGLVGSVAVLAGFLLMAGLEAGGGGHR